MNPRRTEATSVTVGGAEFDRALDQVLRAASRSRDAGVLQCVLIEAEGDALRMVATDKARIAVADLNADGNGASFVALVAATALAELVGGERDDKVVLEVDGDRLIVGSGSDKHEIPLAPGEFPNYELFLADDPGAHTLTVDRAALVAAIEDQPEDEPLRVRFLPDQLELGQIVPISLPAAYVGEDVAFVVNPAFIHDAIDSAAGPEIVIEAPTSMGPIVFRSPGDESFTAVVMPVVVGGRRPTLRR